MALQQTQGGAPVKARSLVAALVPALAFLAVSAPLPASAAGTCTFTQGMPPLKGWVFGVNPRNDYNAGVTFQFGDPHGAINSSAYPQVVLDFPSGAQPGTPKGGYHTIDKTWFGADNPAPILWYFHVVQGNKAFCGGTVTDVFSGTRYYPELIKVMNADHFNPVMVGGSSAKGITTPAASTWSYAMGWLYPNGLDKPPVVKWRYGWTYIRNGITYPGLPPAVTKHRKTETTPAKTTSRPSSSTSKPSGGSATPQRTTTNVTWQPAPGSPPEPASLSPGPTKEQYMAIIQRDRRLAAGSGVSEPSSVRRSSWVPVAAAGTAVMAVLAAFWLRRRRRPRIVWED
jgi:hypothetical protein